MKQGAIVLLSGGSSSSNSSDPPKEAKKAHTHTHARMHAHAGGIHTRASKCAHALQPTGPRFQGLPSCSFSCHAECAAGIHNCGCQGHGHRGGCQGRGLRGGTVVICVGGWWVPRTWAQRWNRNAMCRWMGGGCQGHGHRGRTVMICVGGWVMSAKDMGMEVRP
eukprot:1158371-Pelagomonas_calceolata.AAC.12